MEEGVLLYVKGGVVSLIFLKIWGNLHLTTPLKDEKMTADIPKKTVIGQKPRSSL